MMKHLFVLVSCGVATVGCVTDEEPEEVVEQEVLTGDAPTSNFHYYMQGESTYTTADGGVPVNAECVNASDQSYNTGCIANRVADLLTTPKRTALVLRPTMVASDFTAIKSLLGAGIAVNIMFNPYRPSKTYVYPDIGQVPSGDATGCTTTGWSRARAFACVFKKLADAHPGKVTWTIDDFLYTADRANAGGNYDGFYNRARMRDLCAAKGSNLPINTTVYCNNATATRDARIYGVPMAWHTTSTDDDLIVLKDYVSAVNPNNPSDTPPSCITGTHLALLPDDYTLNHTGGTVANGVARMNSCLSYTGAYIPNLTRIVQNVYARRGGSVQGLSTLGCNGFNTAVQIARQARPKSAEYLFFVQPTPSDPNCNSYSTFSPPPYINPAEGTLFRWLKTLTVSGNKYAFFCPNAHGKCP